MTSILNQIAIRNKNTGDISSDEEKFDFKQGQYHSVFIEWTEDGQDYAIEFDGVTSFREQVRPTLYDEPYDRKKNNGKGTGLQAEIDRLRKLNNDLKVDLVQANEKRIKAEDELAAEKTAPKIRGVEVWTYGLDGSLDDCLFIGPDHAGEEFPVGTVVVSIKKEGE